MDNVSSTHYQRVKLVDGTADTTTAIAAGGGTEATSLRVTIASDSTGVLSVDDNGSSLTVDNAHLTALGGAISGTEVQVDVLTVPADPFGANADAASATGSISAKLRFIAGTGIPITGTVAVSAASLPLPTGASTLAEQQTQSTSLSAIAASASVMDDWDNGASDGASVSGDVAHDSGDAGEPVKIGAKAIASLSAQTLVTANDRTNVFADLDGALITRPHCPLGDIVSGVASNTDGASTEVIPTAGAGIKQYLTSVTLINTSATMIYVELKSGTTVKWRMPVPATGGVTHTFNPPLPPNAADEAWNMDASAATTTLYGSMVAMKSKI